jgi:FMN phosphatase YigB (HAD superfamily)
MQLKPNLNDTILVDCDGVLVDWETKFHAWMQARGYQIRDNHESHYRISDRYHDLSREQSRQLTRYFNESAAVRFMAPVRDSVYWVKRLNWKMGFRLHVITSLSLDPDAQILRRQNLQELYGDIFDKIICLDTGSDKDEILDQYRNCGCWWVEDKPENALAGLERGLKPILVAHDHNRDFRHDHVPRADSWQQIYDIIYRAA